MQQHRDAVDAVDAADAVQRTPQGLPASDSSLEQSRQRPRLRRIHRDMAATPGAVVC
jgi:hypothetical protein